MSDSSAIPAPRDAAPDRTWLDWQDAETAGGDELRSIAGWELAALLSEALAEKARLEQASAASAFTRARRDLQAARAGETADRILYYLAASMGREGELLR